MSNLKNIFFPIYAMLIFNSGKARKKCITFTDEFHVNVQMPEFDCGLSLLNICDVLVKGFNLL